MNRSQWIAAGALGLLAGCASHTPVTPLVTQVSAPDGNQTVTTEPASLICVQPRCPALSARWSDQRPGVVQLTIGLPYQTAQVSGADFHFGRSEVVHLRVPSTGAPEAQAGSYPQTTFDVPLSLIDSMVYKTDGWLRVATDNGRFVDETIQTGEMRSDVVDAMREFLRAVDAATGQPKDGRTKGHGGLYDLLD
ncbi:MAG: hypothetical protein WBG44_09890 [Comamonas sp.]|nr:hypothetical protein [Comamonas sp.]